MAQKKNVIVCCRRCFRGRRRPSFAKLVIQSTIRRARRKTKQQLASGDFDKAMDVLESTGYLD
jgi:hypothetical protein